MIWMAVAGWAQTPVIDDVVLAPTTSVPNGFGAPSVVWDGVRWRVFAETEVTPPPAGCSEAWAIVRVSSTDGVTYGAPTLVQGPSAVTPCGARRPAAVWTDAGTWAVAWEVAGSQVPRIGVTHNVFGARRARVVSDLDGLADPSMVRHDGIWSVVAVDPTLGLVEATSTDLRTFTVSTTSLVAVGATPWAMGGVENPSLSCLDDAGWPFTLAFGGWTGGDVSWTTGAVRSTRAVYVDAARDTWSAADAWPAFDVVDDGTNVGVWFETTDPATGLPAIGLGGTLPVGAATPGRDCVP
jgi:hypothetical protein